MTTEELFDLVAPIAIYHGADVCFKVKAKKALRKLRNVDPNALPNPLPSLELDSLNDWAIDCYNELFEAIVEEETGSDGWEYDKWGAKTYYDDERRVIFSGDSMYRHAWVETAALIKEKINEHYQRNTPSWS